MSENEFEGVVETEVSDVGIPIEETEVETVDAPEETPEKEEEKKEPEPPREMQPGETLLSFEDITQTRNLDFENHFIDEWGGWICVQELTGTDRDAYEFFGQSLVEGEGKSFKYKTNKDLKAMLVQLSIVDKDGNKVFSKKKIIELQKQSGTVITKIFEIAQRISKLRNEDLATEIKN